MIFTAARFLKALPLILAVAAGASAIGYHMYRVNTLQDENAELSAQVEILRNNETALRIANQSNTATIDNLLKQAAEQNSRITTLTRQNSQIIRERDQYLSIFRQHDLTALSRARPGLIEPRINNGTQEVFADLEDVTQP